jgi:hypothetical protein
MPYNRVKEAVYKQLKIEGKPAGDEGAKLGADLEYDYYTMQLFLVAVERLLAHGTPSCKFSWRDDFAMDALRFSIHDLIGAIDDRTV